MRIGHDIGLSLGRRTTGRKKLVVIAGQSNAIGMLSAAAVGLDAAYPAVRWYYRHAKAAATTWFTEPGGWTDLMPRTTVIDGIQFPAGTAGVELSLGRYLAENDPSSTWYLAAMGVDGSGLADEWLNPAFPASGGALLAQLKTFIADRISESGAELSAVVWIQGESDSTESPDNTNYATNLTTLIETELRGSFGSSFKAIVHRLTSKYSGGSSAIIRAAQEGFCVGKSNAQYTIADDLVLRDAAHYDDASVVTLGQRIGAAVLRSSMPSPGWKAVGVPSQVSSVTALTPSLPTFEDGDVAILVVAGIGTGVYATPAGWTAIRAELAGGTAAQIRTFYRVLQLGDSAPTIADIASDDSKTALIFTLRGPTGAPSVSYGASSAVAGTTITASGGTTSAANSLIVVLAAHEIDSANSQASAWTCSGLTFDEQADASSTQGSGTGIAIATAVKSTAGSFGSITSTLAASSTWAAVTMVF